MTAGTVIRGARIVDGTGRPSAHGDVLVREGRVVEVGEVAAPAGARVVDADGRVVAPGFVDMHAHSDLAVLSDPVHLAKVAQGVTTEVLGQDGLSYAPTTDETMAIMREQIAGWNGVPDGVDFAWRTVGEYLDAVDAHGSPTNVAYLVPQGTVRTNVVGAERRTATEDEIVRMGREVERGLEDGAFGMSAGLSYVPGMFASTDELVALCEPVARHGGYFAPHQRSYGEGALDGYAEMIEIARRSGCALHLTHATMNFDVNRDRAPELVALVDAAIADGVDVTLDTYPYLAGATTLSALLPSWAAEGGPQTTLARLRDPRLRERIRHELEVVGTDGCHGVVADWSTIEIAGVRDDALSDRVGATVAQLAAAQGRPAAEVFFDLLVADRLGTSILQHVGHEPNVRTMMRHPRHTGGSDGILVGAKPHPRGWGTFPRYLARYVREEEVLSLEDAVVHLSARPAARLGLRDRGVVRPGAIADLVVFDAATVSDRATFDRPRQQASGIPWVFVAGAAVMEESERTGLLPGRALRSGRR
ncbi:D-aminoacylase [Microbacterium betulae]|uniref:D-aminoacylase n=1 Tax=Microbacterium betulae TaxID=2981139 RepID=A0AA97FFP2_9MICO|nr:D-aminoacylase [Microbacterium sp. AB]WOF22313.1 D-aminoacylase [Microbacterium sp. AB]